LKEGYGPFYDYLFSLMKEIPTGDGKTVFDGLSKPVTFISSRGDTMFNHMTKCDMFHIGFQVFRSACASEEGRVKMASLNCVEYMRPKLSRDGLVSLSNFIGPWVGIDPARASLFHVMSFLYKCYFLGGGHRHEVGDWVHEKGQGWLVFKGPTSEEWFDPWVRYLKSKGVKFHFSDGLSSVYRDGEIKLI
jgi:uncharacterized protein with NAD-binding domain and iron-sulfur cluster